MSVVEILPSLLRAPEAAQDDILENLREELASIAHDNGTLAAADKAAGASPGPSPLSSFAPLPSRLSPLSPLSRTLALVALALARLLAGPVLLTMGFSCPRCFIRANRPVAQRAAHLGGSDVLGVRGNVLLVRLAVQAVQVVPRPFAEGQDEDVNW